jgi:hypothetical protein
VARGFGGSEFAVSGYGIADFVWLAWRKLPASDDGTGLSLERVRLDLGLEKLTAFEMKLTDWRKGLVQAYRYKYFADLAIVVVPPATSRPAQNSLQVFEHLHVGLWTFDKTTSTIRKIFTPRTRRPKSRAAREKALKLIGSRLEFRQLREQAQSLQERFQVVVV